MQWNYGYTLVENVTEGILLVFFLTQIRVYEWHKAFSEIREVIENLPHADRSSISVYDDKIEKIKEIVLKNPRIAIREKAGDFKIT